VGKISGFYPIVSLVKVGYLCPLKTILDSRFRGNDVGQSQTHTEKNLNTYKDLNTGGLFVLLPIFQSIFQCVFLRVINRPNSPIIEHFGDITLLNLPT